MKAIATRPKSAGFLLIATLSLACSVFAVEKAATLKTLGRMPVKEITVFKDGHAFVAQEGAMPVNAKGNVLMNYLPAPVVGTFWPYAADKSAKLTGVTASQRRISVERTALNLRELLEANIGAEAIITEKNTNKYAATIMGIPTRSSEELESTSPPNSGEKLPESGNLILLKTSDGVKAVNIDQIQDVTFKQMNKSAAAKEEFRNLLTLKLDWGKRQPASSANVGLLYLQKGVRWIPSYKVSLDGNGNAFIKLQATLINELTDLEDANVNLVVGVPTFSFKDTIDPIALQQTAAQLSQYFQNDQSGNLRNSMLANNFNNSIMSQQVARASDYQNPIDEGQSDGTDSGVGDSTKNEDLFVFNAGHVTLKKGERMVLALAEFTIPYKDVFTLELPFAPPAEMDQYNRNAQQQEMARLLKTPKVMHKIRLTNKSHYPLTTAPALIFRDGRVLSQGMMTYTATDAASDLTITTAVDIAAKKSDIETGRTPRAVVVRGNEYVRVDLAGKIVLTNHRAQVSEIEVTRFVLGNAESAAHDGKVEKINAFEDAEHVGGQSFAWNWYNWPNWWAQYNGIGRITWKLKLEPRETVELDYKWNYFWL
ncbi:MAG: hypothetical protein JWQ71_2404 [Pedosphaera sp.]|nr:hypothetical protein [Pedosphaera sp.]